MRELRFKNSQDASMYNKGYEQGRADAIDEFVEKADAELYKDFSCADDGEYTITDVALTIRRVGELLKEQKDEQS